MERNTFTQKTLLLCDRGFEGYNLIAHCLEKQNLDFLIRVKQNKSAMREVAKLPMMELDCTIGFTIHLCWGVETRLEIYAWIGQLTWQIGRIRGAGDIRQFDRI